MTTPSRRDRATTRDCLHALQRNGRHLLRGRRQGYADWQPPLRGVVDEVDAAIGPIAHCHCATCRKARGSAFSSVSSVPRDKFRVCAAAIAELSHEVPAQPASDGPTIILNQEYIINSVLPIEGAGDAAREVPTLCYSL